MVIIKMSFLFLCIKLSGFDTNEYTDCDMSMIDSRYTPVWYTLSFPSTKVIHALHEVRIKEKIKTINAVKRKTIN